MRTALPLPQAAAAAAVGTGVCAGIEPDVEGSRFPPSLQCQNSSVCIGKIMFAKPRFEEKKEWNEKGKEKKIPTLVSQTERGQEEGGVF